MKEADKNSTQDRLDTIRKWTRDLFIIAGVVMLVIYPAIIGRFLREAKVQLTFDEGAKTWTLKAIEENHKLATDLAELTTQAQALQDEVKQAKQLAPGGTAPALSSLAQAVDHLAAKANSASESAASGLARQEVAPGAPESAQLSDGWMFLGKVSSPKAETWTGRHYVDADTPVGLADMQLVATGNVFLRAGGAAPTGAEGRGWHARQKVIGGVASGARVRVLSTEIDEAVGGGWAMWGQIRRGD